MAVETPSARGLPAPLIREAPSTGAALTGQEVGAFDPRPIFPLMLSLFIFVAIGGNFLWIWITGQILQLNTQDPGTLITWAGITGLTVAVGRPAIMMYIGFFNAFLATEGKGDPVTSRRALILGLLVFAGILCTYLVVGTLVATAGAVLFANVRIEYILGAGVAAGLVFMSLGVRTLVMMKLNMPIRPLLPRLLAGRSAYAGFTLYGVGFGAMLIGCAFPVLFPLMAIASRIGSGPVTMTTFIVYAMPVASVNVLVTMLSFRFRERIQKVPSDANLVRKVGAALSIVLGASIAIFFLYLIGMGPLMEG